MFLILLNECTVLPLKKKKINEMIIDWSPFVIWSLFNLFKGFCIQKFTFLCIFFLCKN